MASTVCPHCQYERTDADGGVDAWLCPGCGKKYYEAPLKPGLFERVYNAVFVSPPEKWPAAWPCKACKKKVSREAPTCPHCGQPEPYAYKSMYAPFAEAPASHKLSAAGMLVIGLIALFGMARCATTPAGPDHSDAAALTVCQQHISGLLKAPASAKFSAPDVYGTKDEDKTAGVRGVVDAQNSFGVLIRSNYTCILERRSYSWAVESAFLH